MGVGSQPCWKLISAVCVRAQVKVVFNYLRKLVPTQSARSIFDVTCRYPNSITSSCTTSRATRQIHFIGITPQYPLGTQNCMRYITCSTTLGYALMNKFHSKLSRKSRYHFPLRRQSESVSFLTYIPTYTETHPNVYALFNAIYISYPSCPG